MTKSKTSGLGTALVTPFLENGKTDYNALRQLVEIQIDNKTDFIVVLGTTGEAATLSEDEKMRVVQTVVEQANGRIPLVFGLGGNNTAAIVNSLHLWNDILTEHFAAILSVCPYYNKPSQEGLYRHFCAVAEASPVPVILYNVPGRTGVNMLPETVMRIKESQPEKITGIKEASGNIEQIRHLISLRDTALTKQSHQLSVISGDDGITAELMDMGADGLISVAANAFPKDFHRIVHDHDHALQRRYDNAVRLLFKEGNPAGIKTVLAFQGLIHNTLRMPLVSNSASVQREIEQELQHLQHCEA